MVLNIVSADYASKWVFKLYEHQYLIRKKLHFNDNGNHVRLLSQKTGKRFHIKFARELFNSFYKLYPHLAEYGEKGESINVDAIKDMDDDDLIFFARPEQIDKIFFGDLKKDGIIRTNDIEKIETYSIGVSKLVQVI